MSVVDDRRYSRRDLEEVAGQCAGAAAGVFMAMFPDVVMPSEEISAAMGRVLAEWDQRRAEARAEALAREAQAHDKSKCGGPRVCSRCAREEAGEFNRVREAARRDD